MTRPLPDRASITADTPLQLGWHWRERLCDQCLSAGETRVANRSLSPLFNISGLTLVEGEWRGKCRKCEGIGFLPIRSLPPIVPLRLEVAR